MNIAQRQENIEWAANHLRLACAFHAAGKLQQFINSFSTTLCTDYDYFYCYSFDILDLTVDFFTIISNEEWDYQTSLYFSDHSMREYYRLVRIHARRHHLRLKKDPYFVKAHNDVYQTLFEQCRYNCWFRITVKNHHPYGCGLSIGIDENFDDQIALVIGVLDVMCYYENALNKLRDELAADARDNQILAFPAPEAQQKEAA